MPKILLFGATAGLGLWIAHNLLKDEKNQLKVVVRNKGKLDQLFKDRAQNFNEVVIMDLEQTVKGVTGDENPFEKLMEDVDIVINAVGSGKTRDVEYSRIIDLELTKALVNAAKKVGKIQKFILVSSMYVTRPDAFVAFILNTLVGNCLGHKIEAENYLRKSGLDYIVVRPGGLGGQKEMTLEQEFDPKMVKPCTPMIAQGDKEKGGTLYRPMIGKIIAENLIEDQGLPTKLTFEIMGDEKQKGLNNVEPVLDWSSLKADTAESVVIVDHEAARAKYRNNLICKTIFTILVFITAVVLLVYYLS